MWSKQYREHLVKHNNHSKQLDEQLDKSEECSKIKTVKKI